MHETVIDDDRSANVFGLLMSLNMLIKTSDGFDYPGADCSQWMKQAGFRETRVEHLVGPDSMVIGIKPIPAGRASAADDLPSSFHSFETARSAIRKRMDQ